MILRADTNLLKNWGHIGYSHLALPLSVLDQNKSHRIYSCILNGHNKYMMHSQILVVNIAMKLPIKLLSSFYYFIFRKGKIYGHLYICILGICYCYMFTFSRPKCIFLSVFLCPSLPVCLCFCPCPSLSLFSSLSVSFSEWLSLFLTLQIDNHINST